MDMFSVQTYFDLHRVYRVISRENLKVFIMCNSMCNF